MDPRATAYDRRKCIDFGVYVNERLDQIAKESPLEVLQGDRSLGRTGGRRPSAAELAFWVAQELGRPYDRKEVHRVLDGEATVWSLTPPVIEAWIQAINLDRTRAWYLALRPRLPSDVTLEGFRRAFKPDAPGQAETAAGARSWAPAHATG